MQKAEKIQFAIQVKPHLEELLRLVNLLQEGELSEEEILALIAEYGVIIPVGRFSKAALLNLLHSLQTVGLQISQCFNQESSGVTATSTPSAAKNPFTEVFSGGIEFIYIGNNDPNDSLGVTGYDKDTKKITIRLSADAFSICRKYYLDSEGKHVGGFVDQAELPCPTPVRGKEMVNGEEREFEWSIERFTEPTIEGLVRHEIGHGLLKLFVDAYGGSDQNDESKFKAMYNTLVGNLSVGNTVKQDIEATIRDDFRDIVKNRYFPNATERLTTYPEKLLWTEDFADVFSLMGRFAKEGDAFEKPEHRDELEKMTRHQVFKDNFCCWLATLVGDPNLCA